MRFLGPVVLICFPGHQNKFWLAAEAISLQQETATAEYILGNTTSLPFATLPFSCCLWPVAAKPAPWSGCFYGDAEPLVSGAPPEPSSAARDLKRRRQILNDATK